MAKMKKHLSFNVFLAVAVYAITFAVIFPVENRGLFEAPIFWTMMIYFPIIFLIGIFRQRNAEKKERSKVLIRVQYAFVCIICIVSFINLYFLFIQNGAFKTEVFPWQIIAIVIGIAVAEILRKKLSWSIGVKYAANALTAVYTAMLIATVLFLWIAE